jgi:hypothetical protein
LVADAYFSKKLVVDTVFSLGMHFISRCAMMLRFNIFTKVSIKAKVRRKSSRAKSMLKNLI